MYSAGLAMDMGPAQSPPAFKAYPVKLVGRVDQAWKNFHRQIKSPIILCFVRIRMFLVGKAHFNLAGFAH